MKYVIIFLIKSYKLLISPIFTALFGNACRFTPTCSQYTIEALEKFGLLKGVKMGLVRFFKCNPWGGSGYDPVSKK